MGVFAEVNAEGIVTKVFENTGEAYIPAEGSFIIESNQFAEGQRYEPVAGSVPLSYAALNMDTPNQVLLQPVEEAPVDPIPVEEAPVDPIPVEDPAPATTTSRKGRNNG